jgi:hypothetical protein
MSRRSQENIVLVLLLAFFIMIMVISLGYGPNTRMVPLPVSIVAIVLIVFQFIWQNLRSADELNIDVLEVLTRRKDKATAAERAATEPKPEKAPPAGEWRRIMQMFGMIAGLVVVIIAIGPIFTVFLFTAAYFAISGHFSPVKAIIYAAIFSAAGYLLFIQILQIQPYYGLLDPLMGNG